MSEIKAGTMVWVGYHTVESWEKDKREYAGLQREDGRFMCWDRDRAQIVDWGVITTENPFPHPQQPDFIPEGMELWEYRVGDYMSEYVGDNGNLITETPQQWAHFHAFAVKSATGVVRLMNSPIWYTRGDNGMLVNERIEGYDLRAEVLGAVMVKGEE